MSPEEADVSALRTENLSRNVRQNVGRILPFHPQASSSREMRNDSLLKKKAIGGDPRQRKIFPGRIPPAKMNVGGISKKAYEIRYGLRESIFHRGMRKNIQEPVRKNAMKMGDFFVKAYGQSYLDRFDMLRLKFSDKNNNYSRGILPKPIRMPLSLFGTPAMGNIPSLMLRKTLVGRGVVDYRMGRRNRVDNMKQFVLKPFQKVTKNISPRLPFHETRYNMTQKLRKANDWLSGGEQYANSLIAGGMSGVLADRKRKKDVKMSMNKRREMKAQYNETPVPQESSVTQKINIVPRERVFEGAKRKENPREEGNRSIAA